MSNRWSTGHALSCLLEIHGFNLVLRSDKDLRLLLLRLCKLLVSQKRQDNTIQKTSRRDFMEAANSWPTNKKDIRLPNMLSNEIKICGTSQLHNYYGGGRVVHNLLCGQIANRCWDVDLRCVWDYCAGETFGFEHV
jgi:hypothetical protein